MIAQVVAVQSDSELGDIAEAPADVPPTVESEDAEVAQSNDQAGIGKTDDTEADAGSQAASDLT